MHGWSDFEKEHQLDLDILTTEETGISVFEPPVLVSCSNCANPVLAQAFARHWADCESKDVLDPQPLALAQQPLPLLSSKPKKPKQARKKIPIVSLNVSAPTDTKKKSSLSLSTKEKKKVIDLDRHCAVRLESGELCSRSLKCKIHTVNLKRQVQGRSQGFDILYNDYSRKATKDEAVLDTLTPDQEVHAILRALHRYQPQPSSIRQAPSLNRWNRIKTRLVFIEAIKTHAT